jgi:hypothetical protein
MPFLLGTPREDMTCRNFVLGTNANVPSYASSVSNVMLAFDDAELARLVIAASRIESARRGRWLRRVARELEDNARKRDTARRVRECAQRAKAGRRKVWVEIGPVDEDTLMAAGALNEPDELGSRPRA